MAGGGVSRRGLFRLLAGGAKPESQLPAIPAICPPYARESRSYLALCQHCTLCAEACPERIIRPLTSDNEALNGIAILNLDYGECTFCDRCVEACPTGALNKEQGQKEQASVALTSTCDRALGMPCEMCSESCTTEAIRFVARSSPPTIDLSACTGCGRCALSCYSRALTMTKRPDTNAGG